MKKLLSILYLVTCVAILYAQSQYATTTDGKTVLLKADGTWEYVKNSNTSSNSLYSSPTKRANTSSTNSSLSTNISNTRSSSSSKKTTGRTYIRGPRGGCYYINSSGNKTYVDRSLCN